MVAETDLIFLQAQSQQPVTAETSPVLEPFQISTRLAEELQLHLLKFTGTEGEVARGDLVTEGLTDLADTERNFLSGCTLYILEVYKNTLCSLRS